MRTEQELDLERWWPWRFAPVRILLLTAAGASAGAPAHPQPLARRPEFEVASVKRFQGPHMPHGVSLNFGHGTVSVEAGSLRQLVALAYGIQRALVEGGPEWSDSDEFNIVAKTENEGASYGEIQEMLQTLLSSRFKLGLRRETKEPPGYALVLAKNGSKLKLAKDEEVTSFKAVVNGLIFQKMPLSGLVSYLANLVRSPVQDVTGLSELYDFTLDLTPSPRAQSEPLGNVPAIVDRFAAVSAAVEEQLGLKVEARKISAEVIVINQAEHPSEN